MTRNAVQRDGTMRTTWQEPGDRGEEMPKVIATTTWPSYGFDEWFLLAVMYSRWAFEGVLTFFHWQAPVLSFCHTLDVEYVICANPTSLRRAIRPDICGDLGLGSWVEAGKSALAGKRDFEDPETGRADDVVADGIFQ